MEEISHNVTRLVIQLAIILAAAKLGGEVCERFLKTPAVLGELAAGIIIGPFALGGIDFPMVGALFAHVPEAVGGVEDFELPVSETLWSIAQVGSIVLLFVAGMETDLRLFLRYARPASIVAVGGVALPFAFGVVLTVVFGYADDFGDLEALFIGAVLTATSIGITVRVLGDLGQLGSPEGITILGAAVLDDVIGILVLTVIVGLGDTGDFSASSVGWVAFKTLGFWIALTGIGILLSRQISTILGGFQVTGSAVALALALALLAAGLAETFGLAMIIGAFSIGLALSGTELAHRLEEPLNGLYAGLVPIFFVVVGMLVDVGSLGGIWAFGLLITAFAVVGKIAGSGLPALLTGFDRQGGWRIGVGMMPRGEVALIMAGIGIGEGIIGEDLYGVVIIMAVVTTALAPPILALSYRNQTSGSLAPSPQEDA